MQRVPENGLPISRDTPGTLKAKSADHCKCNVRPITGHEGPEALDGVGGNRTSWLL